MQLWHSQKINKIHNLQLELQLIKIFIEIGLKKIKSLSTFYAIFQVLFKF